MHRPGQQVGGGRCDDDEVGLLSQVDVWDRRDVVENVGAHRLAGERLEGRRPDKAQRGFGGDDPDMVPGLGELTNDGARLIGGDTTGDADYDLFGDPLSVHPGPALLLALGVLEQVGVDLAQGDG
ncbi:hypothetical protein NIIDMKKI_43270 [Mycobacterium kansasii]|uniref:Uncharacterized protein n=1 Tax=Mycobacterium kansasii TaxID=1768 RepID=A0A7G1IDJ2_MYCKA|nr:hypothetical protein NIIDMKKI_43270 [Mycobacterium kansasii]